MADEMDPEDRVVAFFNHLLFHKREREQIENALLTEIIGIAKREGYEFSGDDFKRVAKIKFRCGCFWFKWPLNR